MRLIGALALAAGVVALSASGQARARGMVTCVQVPPLSPAARQALATDARAVKEEFTVSPAGTNSSWTDPVSGRMREVFRGPRGKIHTELVTIGRRIVSVDYDGRMWTSSTIPSTVHVFNAPSPALDTANTYRNLIANREAKIIAQTTINGVASIHLRQLETIRPPSAAQLRDEMKQLENQILKQFPKGLPLPKGVNKILNLKGLFPTQHLTRDIWLDASTYLPERIRTITNGRLSSDESDTWLRRTVLNLAETHVVIPAGFTRQSAGGTDFGTSLMSTSSKAKATVCHAP